MEMPDDLSPGWLKQLGRLLNGVAKLKSVDYDFPAQEGLGKSG